MLGTKSIEEKLRATLDSFFSSKANRLAINSTFEFDVIEPGQTLIKQGVKPEAYYIVLEGTVELYIKSYQQQNLKQSGLRQKCQHGVLLLTRNYALSEPCCSTVIGIEAKA